MARMLWIIKKRTILNYLKCIHALAVIPNNKVTLIKYIKVDEVDYLKLMRISLLMQL